LRSAFSLALAANPQMRPARAGDFAAVLRDAAEMTAEAKSNTDARAQPPAEGALEVPVPWLQVEHPVVADPVAEIDTRASAEEEPFDIEIDRTRPFAAEPTDDPADPLVRVESPLAQPQQTWSPPPQALSTADVAEAPARRWPLVAVLVAFGILAFLSIGYFLRAPRQVATTEPDNAVDETTVEIPGGKPAASVPAPVPAPSPAATAPAKPRSPAARSATASTPAPAPSRPASGAVRRTQTGNLLIRSTPVDAEVTVNGRARGRTPLALRELALGSYTIRVAHDGYASEERTLQLTSRRPTFSTTINLRQLAAAPPPEKSGPGGLNVQSRPAGARVYVNDRLAGATPVAVSNVPAGAAMVRIELDGYEPWITKVLVNPGDQTRVAASLERR
jgi:hypothetical protein